MKYLWPHYLPSPSTATCSFLEPAVNSILKALRSSPVLESCASRMAKPSSLKYVPWEFVDADRRPFTLGPHTEDMYMSLKYPTWVLEAAKVIGVSQLSAYEFLQDLSSTINQDPTRFQNRPATWHSQLSQALLRLSTDAKLMSIIKEISIIPLNDGTWTSARGRTIFFSRSGEAMEIPSGIEVSILESNAESDLDRCRLFKILGVQAWEPPEICRLILRTMYRRTLMPKLSADNSLFPMPCSSTNQHGSPIRLRTYGSQLCETSVPWEQNCTFLKVTGQTRRLEESSPSSRRNLLSYTMIISKCCLWIQIGRSG